MTPEQFDQTMRAWTKRQPFLPFVVELLNGERITIEGPTISFGGGVAGFLSDANEFVDFAHDEVRAFEPVKFEPIP